MADLAERRMTVEEFLDWHDGTDTRHMLIDGVVVAKSPVGQCHSRIAGNAAYEVTRRLKPPCTALVEAGLALSADTCVEADVAATCEPDDGGRLMKEPFLVVEVLSPSTRRDDLGVKVVGLPRDADDSRDLGYRQRAALGPSPAAVGRGLDRAAADPRRGFQERGLGRRGGVGRALRGYDAVSGSAHPT